MIDNMFDKKKWQIEYYRKNKAKHDAKNLRWRTSHKERVREGYRRWLKKNRDKALKASKAWKDKNKAYMREWQRSFRKKNFARLNAEKKNRVKKMRLEVFRIYGGACACCGESEPRFLCIDHVNNDGYKFRSRDGRGKIYSRIAKSGKPLSGFQVLCANCNLGKHWNGGVCPHVKPEASNVVMAPAVSPLASDSSPLSRTAAHPE